MTFLNVAGLELSELENKVVQLINKASREARVDVCLKDWDFAKTTDSDNYSKRLFWSIFNKRGSLPRGKVTTIPRSWEGTVSTGSTIHVHVSTYKRAPGEDEVILHELAHVAHIIEYKFTADDLSKFQKTGGAADLCFHPWVYSRLIDWEVPQEMLSRSFERITSKWDLIDSSNLVRWLNALLSTCSYEEALNRAEKLESTDAIKTAVCEIVRLSKPSYDGQLHFEQVKQRLSTVEDVLKSI